MQNVNKSSYSHKTRWFSMKIVMNKKDHVFRTDMVLSYDLYILDSFNGFYGIFVVSKRCEPEISFSARSES